MQRGQIITIVVCVLIGYLVVSALWTLSAPKTDSTHKHPAKKKDAEADKKDTRAKKDDKHTKHGEEPFLQWAADEAIWALTVFIGFLLVLRIMAWKPWRNMAAEREKAILQSVEEAKRAQEETARTQAEFEARMKEAYAEIPKMKEEARIDGENLREELKKRALKEIEDERKRLRREIETARDQALAEIWNQTAQLATLISAKTISDSLSADDHSRLAEAALGDVNSAADQWNDELRQFEDK